MGIKLGSFVMILMFVFIAKISFESATAKNETARNHISDRSPASIDFSYQEHLNKR